jgi:enoyl-CoA hydratase
MEFKPKKGMEFRTIRYEKDEEQPQIVYITLNRPDKSNAISVGRDFMTQEIIDAIEQVNEDDNIKVAIFRGEGKNFSAGYDLEQVYRVYGGSATFRPYQSKRLVIDDKQIHGFIRAIVNCSKVTIAQVHGWCVEAGLWIPEACDIAIAANNTKFAHRGQRLAFGGYAIMPLVLLEGNIKKLTEILITGRTISGIEAETMGIITKAVPAKDLELEVHNLAKAICVTPYDAIVIGKYARRHALDQVGLLQLDLGVVYHTLGTNIRYRENEKNLRFIVGRERMGSAKKSFHKYHDVFEEALDKTKYFKSYRPE